MKAMTDPMMNELVYTTFDPARLKLIYDINTRQAYSTGLCDRAERQEDASLCALHHEGRRQGNGCTSSHNFWTLPVDDPFWATHWPINRRCRCRVMSINQRDYDKGISPTGVPLNKTAPAVVTREV